MLVPWTRLQPSQRARRWRQAGLGIAIISSGALIAAAGASAPFNYILAVLGIVVAALTFVAARERTPRSFDIGVSAAGEIELRAAESAEIADAPMAPVAVTFAAPWLISLRCGTMLVPVWPDCLPHSIFRQLWVHLRWGRAVRSDDEQRPMHDRGGDSLAR